MTKRQRRMTAIALLLLGLGAATALGVTAFRKNLMYFQTPSDIAAGQVPAGAKVRLGGLVEKGSVTRGDGLIVNFTLADCEHQLAVRYSGILPDLFREGQGIVANGRLGPDGVFVADEVLAKHDENYMPPDLAEKLVTKDGKHSCGPFKPMKAGTRDSGLRTAGTRDSGLGTREEAASLPMPSISESSLAESANHPRAPLSRVPSPESRVPASGSPESRVPAL